MITSYDVRCNTTLHNTTQHYTTQHNTALHNTTQHNTTLHYTTLHCTALHCTALPPHTVRNITYIVGVVPDTLVYWAVMQEYRPIVLPLELFHTAVKALGRLIEQHLYGATWLVGNEVGGLLDGDEGDMGGRVEVEG